MNDFDEQLIDLQSRLAYQEDTLRQLDAVTIRQAAQIERLEMAMQELSRRIDGALEGDHNEAGHEPPPHY